MSTTHWTPEQYRTIRRTALSREVIGRLAYRPASGSTAWWHAITPDDVGCWFTSKAAAMRHLRGKAEDRDREARRAAEKLGALMGRVFDRG